MRLHPVLSLLVALPFASNTAVMASESIPVELRMTLTTMPETDSVDVTYRAPDFGYGASTETENLNLGWRLEAGLVAQLTELAPSLSLIGGAWFFYGDQEGEEYSEEGRDLDGQTGPMGMTAIGIDFYLALSWRVSRFIDIEFGPFVGVGSARISDRGVGTEGPDSRVEESGSGEYEEAGVQLAVFAHNKTRSFLIGLGVRYLTAYGEANFSFDLEDTDGNLYPDGLKENVEIGLHGFAPYLTAAITF